MQYPDDYTRFEHDSPAECRNSTIRGTYHHLCNHEPEKYPIFQLMKTIIHTAAIETINLGIGYHLKKGRKKIVHEQLNLKLRNGEVTCLLGLNGAGKSTLLRTLCGFQPPLSGTIYLQGKPLDSYPQRKLSQMVGVVLTEKTNVGNLTVHELVSLGRYPYSGFFGQLKANDLSVIEQSIEAVGISHKTDCNVAELSDGERQKAMIAKALAQQCPIIILDEPTAFLDVTSRIEIMTLLHKLAREQNKAILLSTHDLDLAIQMGDCLWLQGKELPMAVGSPEDLILQHRFGVFFNKDDISFDESTGKISMTTPTVPIGIEGDFKVSYWVGNALIRNGFLPSPKSDNYLSVVCENAENLKIYRQGNLWKVSHTVAELIQNLF